MLSFLKVLVKYLNFSTAHLYRYLYVYFYLERCYLGKKRGLLIEPFINEPRDEISNIVVCATSEGSDQPGHNRSLIRAFASRLNIL